MKLSITPFIAGMAMLCSATTVVADMPDMADLNRDLSHFRPRDQRGINIYEPPKEEGVPFQGVQVRLGGQFALQYQSLRHSNTALPDVNVDGIDENQLMPLTNNFNLATANLDFDVQLAKGLRTHLRVYMSSHHHHETWVKDGYFLVDSLDFIEEGFLSGMMQYLTFKVGHMEIDYGDLHYRRSDSAQGIYNPFVGNTIMDSFTTEVAGQAYFRSGDWIAMAGLTNGKLNQDPVESDTDGVVVLGKLGWDKQVNDDLRVRIMNSVFHTANSGNVRLYGGDRAGSRYYYVTENVLAGGESPASSGRFNPGLRNEMTAYMLNATAFFKNLELHLTYENAKGRSDREAADRTFDHYVADVVYRFGKNDRFYAAGRYNKVEGPLSGMTTDIQIERFALAAGWFLTKNAMAKIEYVDQDYSGYPSTDRLNGAEFHGVVIESVISF